MKPIKIFITSWNRWPLTNKVISSIHERTSKNSFEIHVYDNGSDKEARNNLINLLDSGSIKSLMLDSRNTGCLYNKLVFHSMVESDEKYYIVTDNDIIPPKVFPDWINHMVAIMERHPTIALLTPQLPPIFLQEPYDVRSDIVLCKAVGNTFKMVRREAFPTQAFKQKLMAFGDDGWLSEELTSKGWRVAFAKNLFCYNLERDHAFWGYTEEQTKQDPRKAGYGQPFKYTPLDWDTLTPPSELMAK